MSRVSRAGPGEGVDAPEEIETEIINPADERFGSALQRPVLVVLWHGNGYRRDDCWIQIDRDTVCDLDSYL